MFRKSPRITSYNVCYTKLLRGDRDKYLEIVLGETKRMNTLISDLLNLAKIESGKFPIEYSQFDINELLRRCILTFEQRIEEKQLEVNIRLTDDKLFVWADEDRISP